MPENYKMHRKMLRIIYKILKRKLCNLIKQLLKKG